MQTNATVCLVNLYANEKLEKRFSLIFPNALVSCAGHMFLGISKHSWEVLAHMTKHWQRISWQILSTCNGLSWMKRAFIMCTICWSTSTWTSTHPSCSFLKLDLITVPLKLQRNCPINVAIKIFYGRLNQKVNFTSKRM